MELFEKYSLNNLEIEDKSLEECISLKEVKVPHTFAHHKDKRLGKVQVNIVERLVNKLMRGGTGDKTSGKVIRTQGGLQGKKLKVIRIVENAFDIVHEEKDENPVQVLLNALENSAPREDVTRVSHGAISYQVAVDVSATRRLDLALRNMALAALMGSFDNPKSLERALADEIIATAEADVDNSYAMKKRNETERMARSAR